MHFVRWGYYYAFVEYMGEATDEFRNTLNGMAYACHCHTCRNWSRMMGVQLGGKNLIGADRCKKGRNGSSPCCVDEMGWEMWNNVVGFRYRAGAVEEPDGLQVAAFGYYVLCTMVPISK